MAGLELLEKALAAGLTVTVDGDELVIRGPKRAAAIMHELIDNKAEVMAAISPAAGIHTTDECRQRSEANPARVTVGGKIYDVAVTAGMWFFRLTPEAGWSCCSEEFVKLIEKQLGCSDAKFRSHLDARNQPSMQ